MSKYYDMIGGFQLQGMFPGFDQGLYHDFRVDPFEPSRVWFTAQFIATHSGAGPFGEPTGKLMFISSCTTNIAIIIYTLTIVIMIFFLLRIFKI
jgi:hypothetical protein